MNHKTAMYKVQYLLDRAEMQAASTEESPPLAPLSSIRPIPRTPPQQIVADVLAGMGETGEALADLPATIKASGTNVFASWWIDNGVCSVSLRVGCDEPGLYRVGLTVVGYEDNPSGGARRFREESLPDITIIPTRPLNATEQATLSLLWEEVVRMRQAMRQRKTDREARLRQRLQDMLKEYQSGNPLDWETIISDFSVALGEDVAQQFADVRPTRDRNIRIRKAADNYLAEARYALEDTRDALEEEREAVLQSNQQIWQQLVREEPLLAVIPAYEIVYTMAAPGNIPEGQRAFITVTEYGLKKRGQDTFLIARADGPAWVTFRHVVKVARIEATPAMLTLDRVWVNELDGSIAVSPLATNDEKAAILAKVRAAMTPLPESDIVDDNDWLAAWVANIDNLTNHTDEEIRQEVLEVCLEILRR